MPLEAATHTHAVQVPGSFEGHATRLGYTVAALIYTFFEEDSTLKYLPLAMRERLRYEHEQD